MNCNQEETVKHIILHYKAYEEERGSTAKKLKDKLDTKLTLQNLLCSPGPAKIYRVLLEYLKTTGLYKRI